MGKLMVWREGKENREKLSSRINKLYTFYHPAKNRSGPCQASCLHLALRYELCWWVNCPASFTASHSWAESSPCPQPRGQATCQHGRPPVTMRSGFPWPRSRSLQQVQPPCHSECTVCTLQQYSPEELMQLP